MQFIELSNLTSRANVTKNIQKKFINAHILCYIYFSYTKKRNNIQFTRKFKVDEQMEKKHLIIPVRKL